jgi:choline kinase
MKAVIVAAGRGSRLMNHRPKTLLPIDGSTILEHILRNLNKAGIDEFIIVVGYQAQMIENYLKENDHFGLKIKTVFNEDWQRGNGLSVYAAREAVDGESFVLSMSDHIVSPNALRRVIESSQSANLLLVDPDIQRIFDIDDATKVFFDKARIVRIGKELTDYNGIDCGIFRLKSDFFEGIEAQLKKGEESISAAVRELIRLRDMEAVFMRDEEWWIDIDTPEAYAFARENLNKIER